MLAFSIFYPLGQRRWLNVGPLFHIGSGPTLGCNQLPMYTMTLAQHNPNVSVLAG